MKLTGKLKTQVEAAPTKEEKREAIKQAGMLLTDDELDQVAGGCGDEPPPCTFCLYRNSARCSICLHK